MENKIEVWKDIPNYEGIYIASDFGNIKSLKFNKETMLNKTLSSNKYYFVSLLKKGIVTKRTIHSLIAETFLNHKPKGHKLVVNHINFDKLDNRVENLEIITNRENCNHKHLKSSSKHTGVSWNNKHKYWTSSIYINKKTKYLGCFKTEKEASQYYENALKAHLNNEEIIVKPRDKYSEYTNVSWFNTNNKWCSYIYINGKKKHLGYFEKELDAHNAYQNELNK